MDLGALLILIALLLGVALYLAAPLFNAGNRRVPEESQEVSSLMAERDRIITSLQELDFDFKLGKIPEEDYPPQRTDLLEKGAAILKQLDALAPAAAHARAGMSLASRVENAAAAGRADGSAQASPLSDDDIESMLAARRKAHQSRSAGFCPRCGKPVMITDQFCPNCGKALT